MSVGNSSEEPPVRRAILVECASFGYLGCSESLLAKRSCARLILTCAGEKSWRMSFLASPTVARCALSANRLQLKRTRMHGSGSASGASAMGDPDPHRDGLAEATDNRVAVSRPVEN